MIKIIEDLLKKHCKCFEGISREKKENCIPLVNNYFLCHSPIKNYKKFIEVKLFLQKYLEYISDVENKYSKFVKLTDGLLKIIESNEKFFQNKKLEEFFSFLDDDINYALIENNEVKINKNINMHTIKVTIKKLEKIDKINLPIREGELCAVKVGFYIVILQSDRKIDELIKQVVYARLLWLSAIFEARKAYEIDGLTGAFTRMKFLEDIKQKHSKLYFLNIKNFKKLNEIYTSKIGDIILKEIYLKIKTVFQKDVYRIFADRFAVFDDNIELKDLIELLKNKILVFDKTKKEYLNIDVELEILYFEKKIPNILEIVNIAFKKTDNSLIDYEKEIKPILEEENGCFNIILNALKNNSVLPYFQKVVSLKTKKNEYFEVLMRLESNNKIISPGIFLPIAKQKGLYHSLNNAVIQKAMLIAKEKNFKISLNIDVYDILYKDFIENVINFINANHISPKCIQFEILEEEDLYKYFDEVKHFIENMKKIGSKIALDDFGKGYSNFALINKLDIDTLKIDMSLVKNIDKDNKSYEILKNIINLAKILNIKTTVEGVENENIYKKLLVIKPDYLQGFYFHKPSPVTDLKY